MEPIIIIFLKLMHGRRHSWPLGPGRPKPGRHRDFARLYRTLLCCLFWVAVWVYGPYLARRCAWYTLNGSSAARFSSQVCRQAHRRYTERSICGTDLHHLKEHRTGRPTFSPCLPSPYRSRKPDFNQVFVHKETAGIPDAFHVTRAHDQPEVQMKHDRVCTFWNRRNLGLAWSA